MVAFSAVEGEGHEGGGLRPVRPPEVLRVDDVPVPSPAAGQVLVKVAATSVNLSDWECLRGSPAYARIGGLRSPGAPHARLRHRRVVEAVGAGVTRFRPGDEVYGDNLALKGGFAEYAVAPEIGARPQAGRAARSSRRRRSRRRVRSRCRAPSGPRPGGGC